MNNPGETGNHIEPHSKRFYSLYVEELHSLLRGCYYRATIDCRYESEYWNLIARSESMEVAIKNVLARYDGNYNNWGNYEEKTEGYVVSKRQHLV